MPRHANCIQVSNYHYEVKLDNNRHFFITMKHLKEFLGLAQTTIFRKMKNPSVILQKYKDRTLEITRINRPVFKTVEIDYIN